MIAVRVDLQVCGVRVLSSGAACGGVAAAGVGVNVGVGVVRVCELEEGALVGLDS
jgi:hypothetical protein